ncbi:hypothetical protein NFI96_006030 [Prochilodus magdalenae]|nr:hypothetical protein NFI96_006030 [Prochilodus magdalenae]
MDERFWVRISTYSSHMELSLARFCLTCPHAEISSIDWKGFLRTLHRINSSTETYEGFPEDLSALLCVLESLEGLREMELGLFSLTETWASWTLSIIQACPALHRLK